MITPEERSYLINSMKKLLEEYDYKYTESALNIIIDKWANEKRDLIEAFKRHPNYVSGKFMIAFTSDYERVVDQSGCYNFSRWLNDNALRRIDLAPQVILDRRCECEYLPSSLWNFLAKLSDFAERCISEETAELLNDVIPEVRARVGQKTTRVVNKICNYLGYHNIDGYNKAFAEYADCLSPMSIKRFTVLSINPLDYLTMSFGNSWASCHTIDKKNIRNMPNSYHGAYSSGTISYMLDGSSMVFYIVDGSYNGDEYWSQPKINRQMFHWGEEKLVQGRLYPQDNDGATGNYTQYRNVVQNIMSIIFDFPNLWRFKSGTSVASKYIETRGTHYRDYESYSNCTLSQKEDGDNHEDFIVGSYPICVRCGETHDDCEHIDCCVVVYCEECGCKMYEDNAICIDGKYYCSSHAFYCEMCGEYHAGYGTRIYATGEYVCDRCRDEHFEQCVICGKWEPIGKMRENMCERCYPHFNKEARATAKYTVKNNMKYTPFFFY